MVYTDKDVRMFLHPDKDDDQSKIGGFPEMLVETAKWIREYDPEFVETCSEYLVNDLAICVDWLSLVSFADDGKDLMDKLQARLMEGANAEG